MKRKAGAVMLLEVPERALFERQRTNGLTTQEYETVVETIVAVQQAEVRWNALMSQAALLIEPHDVFLGDIAYAPENIRKLYKLLEKPLPVFQYGKTRTEMYLVKQWKENLEAWERLMKRIELAIEACKRVSQTS